MGWRAKEIGVDLFHHTACADATSAVFEVLDRRVRRRRR
jgi:hypothetical protein